MVISISQAAIYMPPATDLDGLWQDSYTYTLPRPNRHWELLRLVFADYGHAHKGKSIQGFITSEGRFVGRELAAKIAYAANQTTEELTYLISEHVW